MKKSLLILAVCIISAAASAQVSVKSMEKIQQKSIPTLFDMKYFYVDENVTPPARTKSSGAYYKRPQGAYYQGFGLDGYGYYPSLINITPWHTITYENMIPGKAGVWHQYWYNSAGENGGDVLIDPSATVVDGDYTWSQDPGLMYYTPTLRLLRDSFCIGEENLYLNYYGRPQYAGRVLTDSVGMKNVADDHQRYIYNGQMYGNTAAWGALSDNMFGSGKIVDDNKTLVGYQCEQVFDRPMTPLYVESVVASGSSFTRQPIAEGDTLFCYITNVVQQQLKDGSTRLVAGDEIYETLFAVAEDTLGFSVDNMDSRNDLDIYEGKILFSKTEVDEFGIEYSVPVVIDPADFDENGFAIVLDGFDRPGIDFGIYGWHVNDDVDDIEPGRFLVYDNSTYEAFIYTYNGLITMQVGLQSLYDAVEVIGSDENKINVLRISNDGTQCYTDGSTPGSSDDLGGAAVYTATNWFDEDMNDYYFLEADGEDPEWLTELLVDESMRNGDEEGNYVGLNFVSILAEPLPEGVTGRSAFLYVTGRGVKSEVPIVVLQGDVTYEDGINSVVTTQNNNTNRVYNLKGQSVNKNAKGILIQNGKKFINK